MIVHSSNVVFRFPDGSAESSIGGFTLRFFGVFLVFFGLFFGGFLVVFIDVVI